MFLSYPAGWQHSRYPHLSRGAAAFTDNLSRLIITASGNTGLISGFWIPFSRSSCTPRCGNLYKKASYLTTTTHGTDPLITDFLAIHSLLLRITRYKTISRDKSWQQLYMVPRLEFVRSTLDILEYPELQQPLQHSIP